MHPATANTRHLNVRAYQSRPPSWSRLRGRSLPRNSASFRGLVARAQDILLAGCRGPQGRVPGRIGELLLASRGPYQGSFCIALAIFGTRADTNLFCARLDRYLHEPTSAGTRPRYAAHCFTSMPTLRPSEQPHALRSVD
ncbi:DUF6000 family protein [Streptomyces sp. NPDC056549]|uniref:DUF6000 family protein n=1 Tax=Streptomyces sp. NPDC056549 TaxID=3345864 RepID=UPI0036B34429